MMNREDAVKTLLEIKKILDQANIKFWLTCGVLLGAVRDGNFISYDKDIDLIVLAKDWRPVILPRFAEEDFVIKNPVVFQKRYISIHIEPYCYFIPKDVFVYPRRSHGSSAWLREIPRSLLETETLIEFLGEKFRIPTNAEVLLKSMYGDTWKIPRQNGRKWKKEVTFRPLPLREFMGWIIEHERENLWWWSGLEPSKKHK